jgi:plastocyanin
MRRLSAVFLPVVALAFVACGGSSTPSPASSGALVPSSATGSVAPSGVGSLGAPSGATAGACAVAPAGATATVKVTIKDFKYNPQPVQAKVGDVVAWTNNDTAPHSATMDDGSCDTDSIATGATAMLTFNTAGTYTYHCKIHPAQMKDVTVVVQ